MQILEPAITGPCFGVRDALAATYSMENPRDVSIHGELVHNPVVNNSLMRRGFHIAPTPLTISALPRDRGTVLITAHGVSNRMRAELEATGKRIVDTTCPLVRKAHNVALALSRDGFHVIIVGKPGHVEVTALSGDLASFDVVESPADVKTFSHRRLGVICQTTTASIEAHEVLAAIRTHNPNAEIKFVDTICQPTKDRQLALEELFERVEMMVVVGGRNSNNTLKLVERCRRRNVPAIFIQGPGELSASMFDDIDFVGLAAGTSTLPETVAAVRRELESIASHQGVGAWRN